MRIYCQHCGSVINFSGKKPNFCNSCGINFATGKKTPQKESARIEEKQIIKSEGDSEDEHLRVPDISKLDFNLEGTLKVAGTKIGEMSSISSDSQAVEYTPTSAKGPRISKKKFLEQFKQEAGSLRKGN